MVWIRGYIIILMAVAGYLLSASPVAAQEVSSMTAKEYQAEMARWQGREASASSELARINRDIVSLR